jgi:plasmid maintenance system antidote protein VapI
MKTILNLKPFVMKPEVHDDLTRIKERLRILDDKKKKVAKIIGITDVYLSYILNGKRPLTNNVKDKLFEYLGLN